MDERAIKYEVLLSKPIAINYLNIGIIKRKILTTTFIFKDLVIQTNPCGGIIFKHNWLTLYNYTLLDIETAKMEKVLIVVPTAHYYEYSHLSTHL